MKIKIILSENECNHWYDSTTFSSELVRIAHITLDDVKSHFSQPSIEIAIVDNMGLLLYSPEDITLNSPED